MNKRGENEFYKYYKKNIQLSDLEFQEFYTSLKKPLPFTFRVSDVNLIPLIEKNKIFKKIDCIDSINVYQCSKEDYKNSEIRKLIIDFTDIGRVYRQEIASMLPVILLDVQPHHFVLDMCAAPGSKTTQIIEKLENGILVSNDGNSKRCDVLKTHTNKYNFENMIITNNDARSLPGLKDNNSLILFDRILCDVPCSGDGTIRKNQDIIKKWTLKNGQSLFKTQYEILRRGINLLKDEGILVYSTCSFNPSENECVVQKALLELDCELVKGKELNRFKFRKGLKHWDSEVEPNNKNDHLFPNEKVTCLEDCMRIYPHDQDTGGFFIAILKKKVKKLEIKLKLDEQEKGVKIEFEKTIENDLVGFGMNFKDLKDENQIHLGLQAYQNKNNNVELVASFKTENEDKEFKLTLDNDSTSETINEKLNDKKIQVCEKDSDHNIKNTDDAKETDLLNENEPKKENIMLRQNGKDSDFYYVDKELKENIEKQLETKLNFILISQSKFSYTIRLVSDTILEILKNTNEATKVISAGCKGFSINNFKNLTENSFRTCPGILEKINYQGKVVKLSYNDTIKLLENEFVEFKDLEIKDYKKGLFIVKLTGIEGLLSAWGGKNKMTIFLHKKFKSSFLSFLLYDKISIKN